MNYRNYCELPPESMTDQMLVAELDNALARMSALSAWVGVKDGEPFRDAFAVARARALGLAAAYAHRFGVPTEPRIAVERAP